MASGLVRCEECGEWTHPRENGAKRCPKHLPRPEDEKAAKHGRKEQTK